jgi:hypothetical protein
MAMTSTLYNINKNAFMASNDDNDAVLKTIEIGQPAAIYATTGRPEIIELRTIYRNF